jgi:hypothetical protein
MNCQEARFQLAADPGGRDADLERHLAACAACAAYAGEMRRLDAQLLRALQVPVPAAPTARYEAAPASVPLARRRTLAGPRLALAASVAGALVLAGALWSAFPRESLAEALVKHMGHEPESWTSQATLPSSTLAYTLSRSGLRLAATLPDVTYANTCWFRGRHVPHLVVRTGSGPVTVMVMPDEAVTHRSTFDEGGYSGIVVPAPRGAIAVLARSAADADVDAVVGRVLQALAPRD